MHAHGCVWIDHREARIFGFGLEDDDLAVLHDHRAPLHIHRKADNVHLGKAPPDKAFLDEVADALSPFRSIIVFGPGPARTDLAGHLAEHYPLIAKRVVAIEPMDHPSDAEILVAARKQARAADRMGRPAAAGPA